jgi:HK97 family phage major capsid protein
MYQSAATIRARLAELEERSEGRDFTDAERQEFEALSIDLRTAELREETIERIAGRPQNREGEPVPARRRRSDAVATHLRETHTMALRALDEAADRFPSTRAQERIESVLAEDVTGSGSGIFARRLAAAGSDAYLRAWARTISGADPNTFSDEERAALREVAKVTNEERALGLGTQGGSYPVPVTLDPTILLTSDGVQNPIRDLARVVTITGLTWDGVASAGVTAGYGAEFTEASDNSPTLTQPSVNVEKAQAFVPFSIEAGADIVAFATEMAGLFQDAKDTLESAKFLSGAGHGSNEPQGLHVGATAVVNTAGTATFAVGDVYLLADGLAERWQPNASLVASRSILNRVRQFDTAGGASLWTQLGNATPSRLLDYPTRVWSNMTTATSTGSSIMTIGDFRQFLIVDRVGMNVELVPHLFATANNRPYGARGLYCYWRNSSQVLTPNAFRTLKVT